MNFFVKTLFISLEIALCLTTTEKCVITKSVLFNNILGFTPFYGCSKYTDVYDIDCYSRNDNIKSMIIQNVRAYMDLIGSQGSAPNYEKDITLKYAYQIVPYLENKFMKEGIKKKNKEIYIPKLLHQFWITDPDNPKFIPSLYKEFIENNAKILGSEWTIYIWVFDRNITISEVKAIQKNYPNVKLREIWFSPGVQRFKDEFYKALGTSRAASIIDQSKIIILDEMGGAYMDLDIKIKRNIEPLMLNVKGFIVFINSRRQFPSAQDCFFMAPQNTYVHYGPGIGHIFIRWVYHFFTPQQKEFPHAIYPTSIADYYYEHYRPFASSSEKSSPWKQAFRYPDSNGKISLLWKPYTGYHLDQQNKIKIKKSKMASTMNENEDINYETALKTQDKLIKNNNQEFDKDYDLKNKDYFEWQKLNIIKDKH